MEKYTLDIVNKTLTISVKFNEKLQDIDSEEFKLYERFLLAIPDIRVIRKTHKTPSKYTSKSGETFACNQFKNLSYANMETFMSGLPDSDVYLTEFLYLKNYATKVQTNGYAVVRRWFVAQFPEFRKNPLFYLNNRPAVVSAADFLSQDEAA
jgi:hypothetical protein